MCVRVITIAWSPPRGTFQIFISQKTFSLLLILRSDHCGHFNLEMLAGPFLEVSQRLCMAALSQTYIFFLFFLKSTTYFLIRFSCVSFLNSSQMIAKRGRQLGGLEGRFSLMKWGEMLLRPYNICDAENTRNHGIQT